MDTELSTLLLARIEGLEDRCSALEREREAVVNSLRAMVPVLRQSCEKLAQFTESKSFKTLRMMLPKEMIQQIEEGVKRLRTFQWDTLTVPADCSGVAVPPDQSKEKANAA